MTDPNATVTLTKGEARIVVAALADEEMTATGERATRLQRVQDRLAAEFEFDQYGGSDPAEIVSDAVFDTDDTGSVELSHGEADALTDALAAFELDETHGNAALAENVRDRILSAFGGDLVGAGDR